MLEAQVAYPQYWPWNGLAERPVHSRPEAVCQFPVSLRSYKSLWLIWELGGEVTLEITGVECADLTQSVKWTKPFPSGRCKLLPFLTPQASISHRSQRGKLPLSSACRPQRSTQEKGSLDWHWWPTNKSPSYNVHLLTIIFFFSLSLTKPSFLELRLIQFGVP